MKYTVVTLRDSTGEAGAQHMEADDPHAAMAEVAEATGGHDDDLQVLCAIAGEHQAVCACEDASKAAYATDLIRDWSGFTGNVDTDPASAYKIITQEELDLLLEAVNQDEEEDGPEETNGE